MRVFELHFNPRAKNEISDRIFDSFCFEPENIYEKRLGSLYLVGELKNLLPQNLQLLNNLSRVIKEKYYAAPLQAPEKAFENCLKVANEFLAKEVSKENVSWLGNLDFSVLTLKNFDLHFAKTGVLKILLLRAGQIIDISKNLDFEEIEPYPLKIFTKTLSGKLSFGDKIMIFSQEVFDFFSKQNLLNEFLKIEVFNEQNIREILKPKEKEIAEISGILLLIDSKSEVREKPKIVTFQKELEKFSMKEVFPPLIRVLKRVGSIFKKILDKTLLKIERIFCLPKLKIKRRVPKKIGLPSLIFKPKMKFTDNLKRNLILVLILIFVLIAGFFIFQGEEKKQLKKGEEILNEVREKILEAENFLIFKNEEKANILFKEAWEEILPLTKEEGPLKDTASSLKESIETNLKKLSKLEIVTDPTLVFEFDPKEFIPQKITYLKGDLYLFSPLSEKLFKINLQTKNKNSFDLPWGKDSEVSSATISGDSIVFFSKPDKIVFFRNDGFAAPFSLKSPYSDFNFISFSSYQGNLYLLDQKGGEVIKFPSPFPDGKDYPKLWLNSQTKKATDGKSMATDGTIWILRENNIISRYYNGQYQKDLIFDFFPSPERLYKILARPYLPYLYILEPVQNRIIIVKKTGEVIKQFQSEKFESLKDFTISPNGKTIYVLNGLKIYQLDFSLP